MMSSEKTLTDNQQEAWRLAEKHRNLRKVGEIMGVTHVAVWKWLQDAATILDIPAPTSQVNKPSYYRETKYRYSNQQIDSLGPQEATPVAFTDVGWDKVQWISATYNLTDWEIDSQLKCEVCGEPLERAHCGGKWCQWCGKWAYGYDVGTEDPITIQNEW
jgi:hypothetical protein